MYLAVHMHLKVGVGGTACLLKFEKLFNDFYLGTKQMTVILEYLYILLLLFIIRMSYFWRGSAPQISGL